LKGKGGPAIPGKLQSDFYRNNPLAINLVQEYIAFLNKQRWIGAWPTFGAYKILNEYRSENDMEPLGLEELEQRILRALSLGPPLIMTETGDVWVGISSLVPSMNYWINIDTGRKR
jgi:hypothetical protein